MPKANDCNTTNRRAFLTTMAAAVPAVVAGAPIAAAALADSPARAKPEISLKDGIDYFANMMLMVPISAIAENDQFVVYTVRVPREALLGSDPYPCPALGDEKFGCCGLPGGSDSTVDGARARPVGVRPL
jgi:hypothetical protein